MKNCVRATVRCAGWSLLTFWPAIGRAASDEPTYALSWSRADEARECIAGGALAKAVEARLGRSVFVSPAAAEFLLEARIEGGPSRWAASISLQDREGHRIGRRDLTSTERDCRALDQSLSLMLALTIDPNATLVTAGAPVESRPPAVVLTAPPPSPPPGVVSRSAETPVASTAPIAPSPSRVPMAYAEGGFRVSFGMLPGAAAPGVEVAAVVPIQESWAARVGAGGWLPQQSSGADGGVFISQFNLALGICGRLQGAAAFLLLCADAEPGLLAAAGYGFNRTVEADQSFTLAIGPGAKMGVHLGGRFWAQLAGDLLIPLIRHQFYYLKADGTSVEVFRSAAVTGAAGLAVLLAFP